MRKTLFGAAVAAFLAAMPFASNPAQAMALAAPGGLNAAADALNVTEKVHYYGRRYYRPWRGYYRPYYGYYRPYRYRPYYGYYRPYRYYRPYYGYYRPYYPYYRPAFYGPGFGFGPWGWRGGYGFRVWF
jgi:hypothetical protein